MNFQTPQEYKICIPGHFVAKIPGLVTGTVVAQTGKRLLRKLQIFLIQMEISEEFNPEDYSEAHEQKYKPPKKAAKYVSGSKNGLWSQLQHTKYIVFMEHNKEKMRSKEKRRTNKLYKAMASYIETRNALQCRSHHQKLQEKFVYPNKIITNYKSHHDLTLYHQLKQKLQRDERTASSTQTQELKLQEQDHQPYQLTEGSQAQPAQNPSAQASSSSAQHESILPVQYQNSQVHYGSWQQLPNQPWAPYYFYPCFTIY